LSWVELHIAGEGRREVRAETPQTMRKEINTALPSSILKISFIPSMLILGLN
jgi:hypothetical protein